MGKSDSRKLKEGMSTWNKFHGAVSLPREADMRNGHHSILSCLLTMMNHPMIGRASRELGFLQGWRREDFLERSHCSAFLACAIRGLWSQTSQCRWCQVNPRQIISCSVMLQRRAMRFTRIRNGLTGRLQKVQGAREALGIQYLYLENFPTLFHFPMSHKMENVLLEDRGLIFDPRLRHTFPQFSGQPHSAWKRVRMRLWGAL